MQRRHLVHCLVASQIVLAATLALPAWSADFASAVATFRQASDGDAAATTSAATQFTALSRQQPLDPLLLAYAGAATSMQARTTWLPWKKMGYAEDGLAQIDKALALLTPAHDTVLQRGVPVALETKLTAAGTFLALPSMFHRGERGRRLLDEVMQHPAYAGTPAAFQEAARKIAAKAAP
ncbi:hypothetical protein [Sphaerotilus sp.]|jgi:hypothetical protein|uniref:hypothetical protein n=1 Tax=Sphaerotilus sp. TaxID=2093942 RepID=UPI0025E126ED|nr:hypothetical protein [Sphaerotilus sp.]